MAVLGVREPQVTRHGVLPHIVHAGKVAPVVANDQRLRRVRVNVHGEELGVGLEVALITPNLLRWSGMLVGTWRVVRRTTVGHREARELSTDDGVVVERESRDVDVVRERSVVGRDVKGVVLLVVDATLVEGGQSKLAINWAVVLLPITSAKDES